MMLFLRSLLFNIGFVVFTLLTVLVGMPLLLFPRTAMLRMLRFYPVGVEALMRVFCGITVRVEGMENLPPGPVLIVSKHQSAYDTVFWLGRLPDTCYVMKMELFRLPAWGWIARHCRMIAVDRDGGGAALRQLVRESQAAAAAGRQIVIYPEGTRSAPGARLPYQPGVAAMASATRVPVVPVATDSGLFWGRRAFAKRPGVLTVKILPPLPPGLSRPALMRELETVIETESQALLDRHQTAGQAPC